ncbi:MULTISPECIES: hypothetical protein [unclassified Streptomyces]|uniref:hypothetical protein n=1 Tax=unclassified Streptomyces TaxID=2593676 RepID=UPI003415E4DA
MEEKAVRRAGRPWREQPKGSCAEINELVVLLRSWLDETGVSVPVLHSRLTPDHFDEDDEVPKLRQLRERLAGDGLTWHLVAAVADVCSEGWDQSNERQTAARVLWEAAQQRPTSLAEVRVEPVVSVRELLRAQQRTIQAYEEMDRAQRAYEASERERHQALRIATVFFNVLGRTQARVLELTRRVDALQAGPVASSGALDLLQPQLRQAQHLERDLREQLRLAEEDRDRAQQVADRAARRIEELEAELSALRPLTDRGPEEVAEVLLAYAPMPRAEVAGAAEAELDDVERVLAAGRDALERGREAVLEAADDVGWYEPPPATEYGGYPDYGDPYAAYTSAYSDSDAAYTSARVQAGLSGTIPNYPFGPGGDSSARVLSLAQQVADQAISEARVEAEGIRAEAELLRDSATERALGALRGQGTALDAETARARLELEALRAAPDGDARLDARLVSELERLAAQRRSLDEQTAILLADPQPAPAGPADSAVPAAPEGPDPARGDTPEEAS